MLETFIILITIATIRSIHNIIKIINSVEWLIRKEKSKPQNFDFVTNKFIVCIPALDEQIMVKKTLNYFIKQKYPKNMLEIYVVTTSKEKEVANKKSTNEIVKEYIKKLKKNNFKVELMNYPRKDGIMADQINFLAENLKTILSKPNTYFAIYNGDSKISPNNFLSINKEINLIKNSHREPKILQQSSFYQHNKTKNKNFLELMAEGAGLHQTLWTLSHEIPKIKKQCRNIEKVKKHNLLSVLRHSKYTHCVGHGLFIKGNYYLKNYLDNSVLNEDVPYGLSACFKKTPIYPLPIIELALTPAKIVNTYRQKAT